MLSIYTKYTNKLLRIYWGDFMRASVVFLLLYSVAVFSVSPNTGEDRQERAQQSALRWHASGGEIDVKFMYKKLQDMRISFAPAPQFPNKHWDYNHLVYPISEKSSLSIKMPYGNIEKITAGKLLVNSNFSLSYNGHVLKVDSFTLTPDKITKNKGDIVTFKVFDQNNIHLFNSSSIHTQYDKEKGLFRMSNMDFFASKQLAEILQFPQLAGQVLGQFQIYNKLQIPPRALTERKGGYCATRPQWPPLDNNVEVDVKLINIGFAQWMRNIGSDKIIVAPSAQLQNIGTADVPWYAQFAPDNGPYNNDQHPFLSWSIYREIDNRFEQLAVSGVKHAFYTVNGSCAATNCDSSVGFDDANHILWVNCQDVYGTSNNDSSYALGPRSELEADSGSWDNCGSFFDPNCTGSHQVDSNNTDQNRLAVYNTDLLDSNVTAMFIHAWYLIRDDINIFNSMGYRPISPTLSNGIWNMNMGWPFSNGAALDAYVPKNTIAAMQSSQTIETGEGQVAVAVKVVDLGGGLYRYNYAIENYEFDPRFDAYSLPINDGVTVSDTFFNDPDHDLANDWNFVQNKNSFDVVGNAQNEQDWGMLFSFSITTNKPPALGSIELHAAQPVLNQSVTVPVLVPDLIFASGFEN